MGIEGLLRKAGIKTFDPGSQLTSEITEVDPKTGKPRVVVVDGEVLVYGEQAEIKAGLTFLKSLGMVVDGVRTFTEQVVDYRNPIRIGGLPEKRKKRGHSA